jgi:restriction endonuclease S subunit
MKMNHKIDTGKWEYFNLRDLFELERGKRLVKPERIAGSIPLVTAGFKNQGVCDFISNIEMEQYSNAITMDMFGNAFYRGYEFFCDDNILVLTSKNITKSTGLFIATLLNLDKYRNAYGRQYRQKTFATHKIKLPTKKGKPDWGFMESFMDARMLDYCNYLQMRISRML